MHPNNALQPTPQSGAAQRGVMPPGRTTVAQIEVNKSAPAIGVAQTLVKAPEDVSFEEMQERANAMFG